MSQTSIPIRIRGRVDTNEIDVNVYIPKRTVATLAVMMNYSALVGCERTFQNIEQAVTALAGQLVD